MKLKNILIDICTLLLVLLFTYAAASKLLDYDQSKLQMTKQLIPAGTAPVLTWLVPVAELLVVGLLLFKRTRLVGLYASAVLMAMFSVYIAVAMSGWFGRRPCSCGGILSNMGYWEHLLFNVLFVGVAVTAIVMSREVKRRDI
ncbi:putative oxidoreductase [Pedobacter africanus]|uniref:Membrane protein YphA (DoxX/SURF4 family) n=1 Tax=Pedobacter africanus TaxID=151894 RepID=A0ACC6L539_9SPHI|nr:MauE/DoxX family redox-associated membrane protein [Pedobacter africanus]MDR6786466.1 putative membrane protein YphA (DoxX/SURF4 family) [Pedobacter africanus]